MAFISINQLKTEFISARELIIQCPSHSTEVFYDESNNITSLKIKGYADISVDDYIKHNFENIPSKFRVLSINRLKSNKSSVSRFGLLFGIHNKTELYLLPSLYIKKQYTQDLMMLEVYYMGSFLCLENKSLVVCYRYSRADLYTELEERLKNHPNFIKVESYNMFDYYYFKINEADIYKFIDGQYSLLSNGLKEKIIRFYFLSKKDFTYKVLYKDPQLKKEIERSLGVTLDSSIELDSKPTEIDYIIEGVDYFK